MKYYYDDPVEVIYMQKNHCIEIVSSIFEDGSFEGCIIRSLDDKGVWYVHPDSYELLKPRPSDMVVAKTIMDGKEVEIVLNQYIDFYIIPNSKKIIQRNGRAFFMPKVED